MLIDIKNIFNVCFRQISIGTASEIEKTLLVRGEKSSLVHQFSNNIVKRDVNWRNEYLVEPEEAFYLALLLILYILPSSSS